MVSGIASRMLYKSSKQKQIQKYEYLSSFLIKFINRSTSKSYINTNLMLQVEQTPAIVQKAMLKSIVGCLLTERSGNGVTVSGEPLYDKDYARTLFVLIQNPIFASQSTYTILAHLLQHITCLPNDDHQLLVRMIKIMPEHFSC